MHDHNIYDIGYLKCSQNNGTLINYIIIASSSVAWELKK